MLRRPGERYAEVCFDEITSYGGGSVMFWADITSEDRTEVVFIENGSLNVRRYITELLIPHAPPTLAVTGSATVFMDDNARAHRAGDVDEVPTSIEHQWDFLKRRVRAVHPSPQNQNIPEFKIAMTAVRPKHIPQDLIKNLVQSMPRIFSSKFYTHYFFVRMNNCIKKKQIEIYLIGKQKCFYINS